MPTTAAALEALHTDGFVLLQGVLDAAQVSAVRTAIDALEPIHWDYQGLVDDHYKCVFNRAPFWLPYLDLPGVIELAEACLGADCHVIGQTAWRSHPGFVGGELHADYLARPTKGASVPVFRSSVDPSRPPYINSERRAHVHTKHARGREAHLLRRRLLGRQWERRRATYRILV